MPCRPWDRGSLGRGDANCHIVPYIVRFPGSRARAPRGRCKALQAWGWCYYQGGGYRSARGLTGPGGGKGPGPGACRGSRGPRGPGGGNIGPGVEARKAQGAGPAGDPGGPGAGGGLGANARKGPGGGACRIFGGIFHKKNHQGAGKMTWGNAPIGFDNAPIGSKTMHGLAIDQLAMHLSAKIHCISNT